MNSGKPRPVVEDYDPEHRWTNDSNMAYWERRAEKAEALLVRWHEDKEPCGAGSRLDADTLEIIGHLL